MPTVDPAEQKLEKLTFTGPQLLVRCGKKGLKYSFAVRIEVILRNEFDGGFRQSSRKCRHIKSWGPRPHAPEILVHLYLVSPQD